ncbi:MAG: hypothetical protein AAGF12_24560 [Myxococcota bacterium]
MSARIAGILAALGLFFVPGLAAAQNSVAGEVMVVLAKEDAGTIDPTLRNMPALRRPPFDSFRSMQVLSRPRVQLRVNTPATVNLPNGRRVQIVLQQVMPNGRYRVRVSINRPEQNDYLPLLQVVASPGDPFFVAGQSHQGGTLVIGVRVGTRPAGATGMMNKPGGTEPRFGRHAVGWNRAFARRR